MSTTPDPSMPTWMPILGTPFAVRCDLLDEKQALRFHGQSLARLAERGGLGWSEAAALAESRKWKSMTTPDAIEALSKRDAEAALAALRERLEGAEKQAGECDGGYRTLERELATVKDALLLVVQQHDSWAAQMPDGRFDDPLADAIDTARAHLAALKGAAA